MNEIKQYRVYQVLFTISLVAIIIVSLVLSILTFLLGGYALHLNSIDMLSSDTIVYFHSMLGLGSVGAFLIAVAIFGILVTIIAWKVGFIWVIFFLVLIIIGEVGMGVYVYLQQSRIVTFIPLLWNLVDDNIRQLLQDQLNCCGLGDASAVLGNVSFIPVNTTCTAPLNPPCLGSIRGYLEASVYVVIGFLVVLIILQLVSSTFSYCLVQNHADFKKQKEFSKAQGEASKEGSKKKKQVITQGNVPAQLPPTNFS